MPGADVPSGLFQSGKWDKWGSKKYQSSMEFPPQDCRLAMAY